MNHAICRRALEVEVIQYMDRYYLFTFTVAVFVICSLFPLDGGAEDAFFGIVG